jgi:hypothetical protein
MISVMCGCMRYPGILLSSIGVNCYCSCVMKFNNMKSEFEANQQYLSCLNLQKFGQFKRASCKFIHLKQPKISNHLLQATDSRIITPQKKIKNKK